MYVGRFLVAGPGLGAYRVSSRSFPDREIVARDGTLTVVPTADAEPTANPYVSYNCVRTVETPGGDAGAVLGNGSHVDPVAEKLESGYDPRDALATPLLALDFEKDEYDTPRIAAVVAGDAAHVGTVRRDALIVEAVGEPTLVATYERDSPERFDLTATDAEAAAREVYALDLANPVCAAGVAVDRDGVTTAFYNGD